MLNFVFVGVGTIVMFFIMVLIRNKFDFSLKKCIPLTLLLTFSGVLSVMIMYFIENGKFGGLSFFGAVFFIPLFLFPISFFLKVRFVDYLDISSPCVCAMLTTMKINCLIEGCCEGRILSYDENGIAHRFPSQIVELITASVICAIIVSFICNNKFRFIQYPIFMVLYGTTRFALNLFRETTDFFMGLAIGNIWAILSTVIGVIWIMIFYVKKSKTKKMS